jgi:hypothetical protein
VESRLKPPVVIQSCEGPEAWVRPMAKTKLSQPEVAPASKQRPVEKLSLEVVFEVLPMEPTQRFELVVPQEFRTRRATKLLQREEAMQILLDIAKADR